MHRVKIGKKKGKWKKDTYINILHKHSVVHNMHNVYAQDGEAGAVLGSDDDPHVLK